MKKSMIFLGCIALLMAGCNKIENMEEPVAEAPGHLTIDIKVNQEGETRAVKKAWEVGDKIYLFFDNFFLDYLTDPDIGKSSYSTEVQYLTLTFDGFTWQSAFSLSGLENYLLSQQSGTLFALYFSNLDPVFQGRHTLRGKTEEFFINVKNGHNTLLYMFADNVDYTVTNGTLSANVNMHLEDLAVHFFLPGIPSEKVSRFGTGIRSDQFTSYYPYIISSVNQNSQGFQPATLNKGDNSVIYPRRADGGIAFDGCLKKESYRHSLMDFVINLTDVRDASSTKDDLVYTLTKNTTFSGKDMINLPALTDPKWVKSHANPSLDRGFLNGHEWVLMSDGRKWATMNFRANDVDEYGSMSMWSGALVHAQSWGEGWRLPTMQEWLDLLYNNAGTTRINQVVEDGVFTGVEVVRLNNAATYTVDRMFLPAGGCYDGTMGLLDNANGYYWTDLAADPPANTKANAVKLLSDNPSFPVTFVQLPSNYIFAVRPIVNE